MGDILKTATDFMKKHNLSLELRVSDNIDSTAYYDPNNKIIFFSSKAIVEEANKWKSDPEDYLILVLCHEIGHHLNKNEDKELSIKINELSRDISKNAELEIIGLVKKREILAGELGKKFIPENKEKEYEILNLVNLEYRCNSIILQSRDLKHKNEIIKLYEKLSKQSKEIINLMEENSKLREENYKLEFNIKD